ncbi:hypothetical protein WR25_17812 [Diploscapter pachys]|nr:hypothetical protein WR25_17812 [Diploscapter pachys]
MSREQPILIAQSPLISSSSSSKREERPMSMNLSENRGNRSKSETSRESSIKEKVFTRDEFPRYSEFRVPVRIERTTTPTMRRNPDRDIYKTHIAVDDSVPTTAILRPKRENLQADIINNNNTPMPVRHGLPLSSQMRKSCPDLDTTCSASNFEEHRVSKKRNRRAKEKARDAAWRRKRLQDWTLDDVLLWLQSCQLEEVASLLIGYDLRGEDLFYWDHHTLSQLGVTEHSVRSKILEELKAIQNKDPEEEKKKEHKTLFDIVKQTCYDQVLAVETPLTTRDITVTHGRLGCLQITKVNGANLALKEQDCLLEINERPGEQFKSALMLTKLISDSNGASIRFVVLRRKTLDSKDDNSNDTSSGISSSPQTPSE